jgi:hypothetical protein
LLRPLVCVTPFSLLFVARFAQAHMQAQVLPVFLSVAFLGTFYLLWNFGLVHSERQKLMNALHI